MTYVRLVNHSPRSKPGSRPSPASRRVATFGGVTVTTTRGRYLSTTTLAGNAANTARRIAAVADNTVRNRVREAIRQAFPYGQAHPRYDGWRAVAGGAARTAGALADVYEVTTAVDEALKTVSETVANQWWQQTPGQSGVNPGLTFRFVRAHTEHVSPGNFARPSSYGSSIHLGSAINLAQNNWLLQTTKKSDTTPTGLWWNDPDFAEIPAGWYWRRTVEDYQFVETATTDRYYRKVEEYRNNTPAPLPPYVNEPAAFPLPLGVPLPEGIPAGFPLAEPMPQPRPLPRPVRLEEVAIEIPLGPRPVPRVYPARPRKPGPKAKETKAYGKSGVASVAFWLYEATDDWADWVNVLVNAIPDGPGNAGPLQQLKWLRDNPEKIATADWGEVVAGLAGWLVDEAFGAFVGNINKNANRSVSVSSTTIDMRTNAPLHYAPSGGSPGAFVSDFLNAFL